MWPFNKKKEYKFIIEEYPLSRFVYVKVVGNGYLKKDYSTGVYAFSTDIRFADQYRHVVDADAAIAVFKEQRGKKSIIVHNRN